MHQIPMLVQGDPDDPDCADVTVPGSIAGRSCWFRLDTGAARTQVLADGDLADLVPVRSESSAGAFGQAASFQVVTVTDLAVGDLVIPEVDVTRVAPGPGQQYLLGMDVLGRYRCRFRFDTGLLELAESATAGADLDLTVDDRGHPYVELSWDGVSASACFDTGGGITAVDKRFRDRHLELFTPAGSSSGLDSTGASFSVPTFMLAGPLIGGVRFPPARVAVLDLAPINTELEFPMDLILGAPTIRHANWLFDFPARRWAAPVLTGS
jgi:predicted aspartyl protease